MPEKHNHPGRGREAAGPVRAQKSPLQGDAVDNRAARCRNPLEQSVTLFQGNRLMRMGRAASVTSYCIIFGAPVRFTFSLTGVTDAAFVEPRLNWRDASGASLSRAAICCTATLRRLSATLGRLAADRCAAHQVAVLVVESAAHAGKTNFPFLATSGR